MRKIKFRGRCLDGWIYSECIWFNEFPTLNDRQIYMPNTNNENCDELNIETWDMVLDVGQYTGVKDKNGKEIYEGDIIKYSHSIVGTIIREVRIKYGMWGIEGMTKGTQIPFANLIESKYEVIGNKFENPELLG